MDIISEIKRDSSYTLLTVRIRIRCALNFFVFCDEILNGKSILCIYEIKLVI